jgi:uncharacterized small protein (DUF1192 family)
MTNQIPKGQASQLVLCSDYRHGSRAECLARWEEDEMAREDDDLPVRRRRLEPLALDSLGIEEMRLYIGELQAEIARVEADIHTKQSHRSAADAFFRRPSSTC